MATLTKHGITYFQSDLEPISSTVKADFENTTVDVTIAGVTLNFTRDTYGDPDVVFADKLEVFQYFEYNYCENNPGTIDNVITAYVGQYYSDTVVNQKTIEDD
tara:strand:- start:303 stop:611 length:309 start_codon:yes stop_codon:yes gene_type:complete